MISETYPPSGNSRPDDHPRLSDESLLEDLLLRLEELWANDPNSTPRDLIDSDSVLGDQLRGREDLTHELEQRWSALRRVDGLISSCAGNGASLPSIPGYDIFGELDRGGTAVVYSARQQVLNRPVAVKMLLAGRFASPRMATRFETEATTIAKLCHRNIVEIHDRGQVDGNPFLVMERVDGGNLKTRFARRRLSGPDAAELLITLSQAVEYAHQQGVVHRDLKPANVLVTENGECKISDFGLAILIQSDSNLTRTGELPGTPSYMAPEQVSGDPIGPWTDVYALGTILYEGLTGRPPFEGPSNVSVLAEVSAKDPVAPRRLRRDVPRDLEAITLKCLEKIPQQRYGSAAELATDLQRYLDGQPTLARAPGPVVRASKWARRRPTMAALMAVSLLALVTACAGTMWHMATLSTALAKSETLRQRAETSEQLALERERDIREQQYARQMRAACDVWKRGDAWQLNRLLDPYAEGTEDAHLRGFEWYFLRQQTDSSTRSLRVHQKPVNYIAFSPDDRLFATASDEGMVKLWDTATAEHVGTLRGHTSCVNEVHFSPDGTWLATASCDKTVKLWDAESLQEIATLDEHRMPLGGLAISPNGENIAAAVRDPIPSGEPYQGEIVIWDVASRRQQAILPTHQGGVHAVAFLSDGKLLASAGVNGIIRLWDTSTWKLHSLLTGHTNTATCLDFSPKGKLLASGSFDSSVIVWDVTSGQPLHRLPGTGNTINCLKFLPSGKSVVVGDQDNSLRLWDVETGMQQRALLGHQHQVISTTVNRGANLIASGSDDGTLKLWNANDRSIRTIHGPKLDRATLAAFTPDLSTIIVSQNGRQQLWDLKTGELIMDNERDLSALGRLTSLKVSPSGDRCAAADSVGNLEIWDLPHWRRLAFRSGVGLRVDSFSADNRMLVTKSGDSVVLWDAEILTTLKELKYPFEIESACIDPSGSTMAIARDGSVERYDVQSLSLLSASEGHRTTIWSMFSSKGPFFSTVGHDEIAIVWDWETGNMVTRLVGHESTATCVAFSSDHQSIATGGADGTVRVWHVATGLEMLVFDNLPNTVSQIQFSDDGKQLACLCYKYGVPGTGEIRIWSVDGQ